ncbi:MAG: Hpt domain-containing protein, partial [Gemmatimonadota bacterium]|nr:Hpt domain-containing protein [Gemmatimonadota bacterium]
MDLSRYAELFLTESREHLSAINHLLLELERAPPAHGAPPSEAVSGIFRAVHTIKGMSATMGYAAVADLAHELETLLDRVRRGECQVTPDVLDACFAAADALERAVDVSVEGREADIDVRPDVARLRALAAAPAILPSSEALTPPPVDESRGVRVLIRVHPDAMMRGVRAMLAVRRAEMLGPVRLIAPTELALQADDFAGELTIHIETAAARAAIEETIRAAGDIAAVDFPTEMVGATAMSHGGNGASGDGVSGSGSREAELGAGGGGGG